MRRVICIGGLVLLVLLTMTSCLTSLNSKRIEFKTYCYGTKIADKTLLSDSFSLSKSNKILVFIPSNSFQIESIFEESLEKELRDVGISCEIVSDYYDVCSTDKESEVQRMVKEITSDENKERWGYDVELFGEIKSSRTYTTGGGVSEFEIVYHVYYDYEEVASISVACESVRNTLKGFRETLEVASREMAEAVVDKYLTYLK